MPIEFILLIIFVIINVVIFVVCECRVNKAWRCFNMERRAHYETIEALKDVKFSRNEFEKQLNEARQNMFKPVSELCRIYQVQNCQACDRLDCGDNMTRARDLFTMLQRAKVGFCNLLEYKIIKPGYEEDTQKLIEAIHGVLFPVTKERPKC